MKLLLSMLLWIGLALGAAGCGSGAGQSPITPASDSPTFLYFYTDG